MEIDLNHHAVEEGGDCFSSSSSCCVSSLSSSSSSSIYLELWHACAGPLVSLPKKGSLVVYFPQGHLEQASSSLRYQCLEMSNYGLPPQVFCRVVDVQLHAEKENDEVYAQVTLFPQSELKERNLEGKVDEEEDDEGVDLLSKSTPHMFCKTLTASDTSTHGGFSVPRRAAEDCFPPLDYKQQRPSQELVAKDLHGVEWRFRHIYRGQPRRHLLTTGWSIFVNQKNLVSGDAVLFLRGEGGELRLGIRRAGRPRNGIPYSILSSQNMHLNILSPAANAISTKSMFHVFYSPRASPADFVIPYQKYIKSINRPVSIGMRFKMKFEMEDAAGRRFNGVINGIGDMDPLGWPDSKWRCLMVRWDEDIASDHQERVSPWEIEPSISLPPLSIPSGPQLKKLRTISHATSTDVPISAGGGGHLDFGESVRSSKVLQGQENVGFRSPYDSGDQMNRRLDLMCNPAYRSVGSTRVEAGSLVVQSASYDRSTDFGESERFQKVLQGQEIFPLASLHGRTELSHKTWEENGLSRSLCGVFQKPNTNFFPFVSEDVGTMYLRNNLNLMPFNDIYSSNFAPLMQPYMTNFERGGVLSNLASTRSSKFADISREDECNLGSHKVVKAQNALQNLSAPATPETNPMNSLDEIRDDTKTGCKLFGFSLNEGTLVQNSQNSSKRSCTKVHKQGNMVGRAIDLSKLHSYDDLYNELERLFSMEGLLCDPEKGWQVVYKDSEHDMMLVGDDPWHEFCDIVSKIHIYTQEEVEKLTNGTISDDTQSCLEEAPALIDVSKSSSHRLHDSYRMVNRI